MERCARFVYLYLVLIEIRVIDAEWTGSKWGPWAASYVLSSGNSITKDKWMRPSAIPLASLSTHAKHKATPHCNEQAGRVEKESG